MIISIIDLETGVYQGFSDRYKAFGPFMDSGALWDACISVLRDVTLMNHIIFCNDVHQIPPVHTFLKVVRQKQDLSEFEKRSVGAFWGYIFKFVLGYRNQHSVTAKVNTVKTATYFFDIAEKVIVADEK